LYLNSHDKIGELPTPADWVVSLWLALYWKGVIHLIPRNTRRTILAMVLGTVACLKLCPTRLRVEKREFAGELISYILNKLSSFVHLLERLRVEKREFAGD
jgi:hypothetical protein